METVGQYLRQQRVARQISLATAAAQTRIQPLFLEAIENDRWDPIPHSVSAKGFIRSYAQFLHLDPVETMQRFSLLEPPGHEKALAVENVALKDMGHIGPSPHIPLNLFQKAPLKAVAVLSLLVGFLFWLSPKNRVVSSPILSSKTDTQQEPLFVSEPEPAKNADETQTLSLTPTALRAPASSTEEPSSPAPLVPSANPSTVLPAKVSVPRLFPTASSAEPKSFLGTRPVSSSVEKVSTTAPSPEILVEKPISKRTPPLVLSLEADTLTWVKLVIDNHTIKDVLLQPGDRIDWSAEEKFLMTLGNAGGVRVSFNGQNLGILGNPNEVIRDRLFTAAMIPNTNPVQNEKRTLEKTLPLEKEPL